MESGADWIPSQAEWEAIGSAMTEYPDLFDELGFDMRGIPGADPLMVSPRRSSRCPSTIPRHTGYCSRRPKSTEEALTRKPGPTPWIR